MHSYLRSVGFGNIKLNKELRALIADVISEPDSRNFVSSDNDYTFVEYRKKYAPNMGIAVCGTYSEYDEFEYEYYFPYFISDTVSSNENITVEKHSDKDSFAGVCDEYKVGVSLIFYLQNRMDYLKELFRGNIPAQRTVVNFSGLSNRGMIVLPLVKNDNQREIIKRENKARTQLIAAAKAGDETAIESLTLEDIDTFSSVSRRIRKHDVFTLVDTYFMPSGVECDHYSIMGEIKDYELVTNHLTNEKIYIISLRCNDLDFEICINKDDLIGEPDVARRFKGEVWMQGIVGFP